MGCWRCAGPLAMKLIAIELVKELSDFPLGIFPVLVLDFGFYTFSSTSSPRLFPSTSCPLFLFPDGVRVAPAQSQFGLWKKWACLMT